MFDDLNKDSFHVEQLEVDVHRLEVENYELRLKIQRLEELLNEAKNSSN